MKSVTVEILLLLLAAFSSCSVMQPQDKTDNDSPFNYDWETLRAGGLVFAGILCFLGIVILLSGKCKCKFNKKKRYERRWERLMDAKMASSGSPVSVAPKGIPIRTDSTDC